MAKSSLSNSNRRTVHLSADELKDHHQLMLIGSVLSQLFHETNTLGEGIPRENDSFSYIDALEQIIQFIKNGHRYAKRWDQLAARMQLVYEKINIDV